MSRLLVLAALGALALEGAAAAAQALLPFDPEHQRAVSLATPDFTAEVVAQAPDAATGQSRGIRIRSRAGDALIPLPFQFYQVNQIVRGPSERLVVIGESGGSVYQVGVIDIAARRVLDRFMCYIPAVSEDGQYVAFTKFFAPHEVLSPEDHAMLYVVGRSASENRPPGAGLDDDINVGFALYPVGMGNRDGDNVNVQPGASHAVAGYYFWRGIADYFFAVRAAKEFQIIWVSIAGGKALVRGSTVAGLGPERNDFPFRLDDVEREGDDIKVSVRSNTTRLIALRAGQFADLASTRLYATPAN
ncbi:MAG TPA: hypothetical protein VF753_01690 [Terriglobales bacterium]